MIKNRESFLIWIALSLAVFSLFNSLKKQDRTISPTPMSIMDKIQKNRKLTCGYVTYAPYLQKNLQTSHLEGPVYDLIEELGKTLEVRINWAEETDWDTMIQSLQNKRFDALCSFAWMDTRRAKSAQFSVPVLYNTLYAYGRKNEHRFSGIQHINHKSVTISVLDGSPDQRLAETRFPNAHIISAPSAGQPSKVLLDVITDKADIALTDPAVVNNFLKKNPKTLQQLGDGPAQIFPLVMILPKDNPDLKTFIDTGLSELINKGAVNDIFAHYPDIGSSILFVNRPYQRIITSDDTVNAIKKMDRDAAK